MDNIVCKLFDLTKDEFSHIEKSLVNTRNNDKKDLKEIFSSGELREEATTRKIRAIQNKGNRQVARDLDFYNLDATIAVWSA